MENVKKNSLSTGASMAAGGAGAVIIQLVWPTIEKLLFNSVTWEQIALVTVLIGGLIGGAVVINHYKLKG